MVCCSVAAKAAVSSADGTKLAAVTEEGVDVYETATGKKVSREPAAEGGRPVLQVAVSAPDKGDDTHPQATVLPRSVCSLAL